MREYLLQILTEDVDEYLRLKIHDRDGVDGYSDLCHSFFNWLENKLDTEGI